MGSVGTGLLIGGILAAKNNLLERQSLIAVGSTLLVLNFFLAQALKSQNENLLFKAIKEYNKENLPKIYFIPYRGKSIRLSQVHKSIGFVTGIRASF